MINRLRFTGIARDTVLGCQAVSTEMCLAMGTLLVGQRAFAIMAGYESLDQVSKRIDVTYPAFLEVDAISDVL